MRVLLLTWGSRGDVQPFVALARALDAAGHEVVLGAPASQESLARLSGTPFVPLHDGIRTSSLIHEAVETNFAGLRGKKVAIQVMQAARKLKSRLLDDLAAAADEEADIVVHHAVLPGNELAERLGAPSVPVCVVPAWVPTDSFPSPLTPFRIPDMLNRTSYPLAALWLRILQGGTTKWRRETLALPRRRGHHNVLRRPDGAPTTVLQSFSRHVLPTPLRYPDWVHTTGFWFMPFTPGWRAPDELSNFLNSGPPPICIGFGSSIGTDPHRRGGIIAEAVRLAGVRAVVVGGSGGIRFDEWSDDVLYVDEVPFDWLLPRTAAVVHHGGIGTIGAALAAGRPQVVCPFNSTQPFLAHRMQASGAAPAPQPQHKLTPGSLADAMRKVVRDPALALRARELGKTIRAEDGVANAVEVLESVVCM